MVFPPARDGRTIVSLSVKVCFIHTLGAYEDIVSKLPSSESRQCSISETCKLLKLHGDPATSAAESLFLVISSPETISVQNMKNSKRIGFMGKPHLSEIDVELKEAVSNDQLAILRSSLMSK